MTLILVISSLPTTLACIALGAGMGFFLGHLPSKASSTAAAINCACGATGYLAAGIVASLPALKHGLGGLETNPWPLIGLLATAAAVALSIALRTGTAPLQSQKS